MVASQCRKKRILLVITVVLETLRRKGPTKMEWFCCVASDRQNCAASDPETIRAFLKNIVGHVSIIRPQHLLHQEHCSTSTLRPPTQLIHTHTPINLRWYMWSVNGGLGADTDSFQHVGKFISWRLLHYTAPMGKRQLLAQCFPRGCIVRECW